MIYHDMPVGEMIILLFSIFAGGSCVGLGTVGIISLTMWAFHALINIITGGNVEYD